MFGCVIIDSFLHISSIPQGYGLLSALERKAVRGVSVIRRGWAVRHTEVSSVFAAFL